MDFTKLLGLLPLILKAVDVAQNIMADRKAGTGLSTVDTVRKELPDVFNIFQQIGATLFPSVPPSQQPLAAATALDIDTVTKLQAALNANGAALTVDGHYGPATKAAVLSYQKAHSLTPDEWAGPVTLKSLAIA